VSHREETFEHDVMLSRSRYYAPATHSLRFFREYFAPHSELTLKKTVAFMIQFKGVDFYINIDTIINPDLGHFLEVKSRTWSREDAVRKSKMIAELIDYLGASPKVLKHRIILKSSKPILMPNQKSQKAGFSMTINVLFLAAESEPFVKIGGLGDVAGALPDAIHRISENAHPF
jgi:hypothetical protein